VQIREIAELDLGGQLVVLSACRTAGGVILDGEGPMSLARPFLLAGATTVVASLWPLSDREAAELFDRFYRYLAGGLSVAAAMSATRRDLVRMGAPVRTWSGVVVLGNGDRKPCFSKARARLRIEWVAVILIAAALGGILWVVRKTRVRMDTRAITKP